MDPEAIEILNKIKSGELSTEEGAKRLQELESRGSVQNTSEFDPVKIDPEAPNPAGSNSTNINFPVIAASPDEEPLPDMGWWKKAWMIPFWAGTVVIVLSALWMGSAYSNRNFFWFCCSWLPMLLGMLVLILGWWSQQARWVHVRVNDANGTRVAISLPLPLRLAGWLLHMFGRFIPKMDQRVLENLPEIFDVLAKEKGPTSVEVDEKDGTRVRVYIL